MKTNYKMIKKGGIQVLLLAFVLFMGSCEKYLDIKRASFDKFIETADDCQRLLDNYGNMNTNYPSDGLASSDDYYLGNNVYPVKLSQEDKDIYTWQPTAIRAVSDPQWLKPYGTVYSANLVLGALDRGFKENVSKDMLDNLKGSSLFYRAYALWNVAQLYAKPYGSAAASDPGIPARTSADLSAVFGRGTVKETYDQITKDLKDAISLLPVKGVAVSRPDKASAYAMLARVYLSMEDYDQALANASSSLSMKHALIDYNTISTTSFTPFDRFNDEVLFHSTMAPNDNLLKAGDETSPTARTNLSLYNMYNANDLRKSIFFKQNTGAFAGTYRFTGNYEPDPNPILFNGLTTSEMYLTRAECYARAGKTEEALKDLNDLLVTRFKTVLVAGVTTTTYVPYSTGNADVALGYVLNERRKELVMRGLRWTDLRRLNKDEKFKTDLERREDGTGAVLAILPANDLRYTLLIPLEVITNAAMQQNPR